MPFDIRTAYRRKPTRAQRGTAASKIQQRWRQRRGRKATFTKRVNQVIVSQEPQQYCLKDLLNRTAVSQAPAVYDISNVYYNRTDQGLPNPKWYRSSNKIKVQNLHIDFRVQANRDDYNVVTVCLVRHKRTQPIVNTDVQASQIAPPATVPDLQSEDKPFLPTNAGHAQALNPTAMDFNFGSTTTPASVESLTSYFNPKVVDLIWHKTVKVQPLSNTAPDTTYPTGWPFERTFSFNKKLDEIWKYPSPPPGTAGFDQYPTVNNKCYHLIVWSDSLAPIPDIGAHPVMDAHMRMSFKDID